MPRRSRPVGIAGLLAALSLGAGCVTLCSAERQPAAPWGELPATGLVGAEPEGFAEVPQGVPALIQTIHANGAVWLGYNVAAAQTGDLDRYDAGEGMAFGLAFGNGQDVKRFFELGYEASGRHKYNDASGTVISGAHYERYYFGLRRYLLPVAAEESRRIAPMLLAGVTHQILDGDVAVQTPVGYVERADCVGLYVGTGLELYIGSSSQIAISLDVRLSFLEFDGVPTSTGRMGHAGGALAVVYHF